MDRVHIRLSEIQMATLEFAIKNDFSVKFISTTKEVDMDYRDPELEHQGLRPTHVVRIKEVR